MSEIMQTKEYLLKTVSSVLNGTEFDLPSNVNYEKLYSLAKRNAVSAILFAFLNGKTELEIYEKLTKEYKLSALRDNEQQTEIELIRKEFSENGIDFMLLKGTHLKELYPRPELRFMVDMDILVRDRDKEMAYKIIESHSLTKKMESDKDFVFIKPPFLTVEVHRTLFIPENKFYPYFKDALSKAEKCGEHEYKMNDNDLYIYTLAHLCEHYLEAGSCFRPCMDLYLLKKNRQLDFELIDKAFEELGILKFAKNIEKLLGCMFDGEKGDETAAMMENYILLGAPVKNAEEAAIKAHTNESKSKRIKNALFPSLTHMRHKYNILNRCAFLLPLFWLIRIFGFIFSDDKKQKKRKKNIISVEQSSVDIMKEIFEKSGLE